VALAARSSAGHRLGLLLLAAVLVSYAAALLLRFAAERNPLSAARRRTLSIAVAVVLALVPVAGVAALAHSSRGLTGEISHGWHQLTTPNGSQPTNSATRFRCSGRSIRMRAAPAAHLPPARSSWVTHFPPASRRRI